jgi:hypothetical protein
MRILFIALSLFFISVSLSNYYKGILPTTFLHHLGVHPKRPFRPAVKFLKGNFKKGDVILYTNMGIRSPFNYYLKKWFPNYFVIRSTGKDPYWERTAKYFSSINLDKKTDIERLKEYKRIWLLSSSWARDWTLDENSVAVRKWMLNHYKLKLSKWIYGILIELYTKD